MKSSALVILFILFGASVSLPVHHENVSPRNYANQLNKTMDCVKTLYNKGKPEIGLPSYDPLIMKDLVVNFDIFGLSFVQGNVSFKTITFFDVMKFVLTHIEVTNIQDPEALKFHIIAEWPEYSLEAEYDIDLIVKGTPMSGKGSLKETITKYRYDVRFKAALPLDPEDFSIEIAIEGLDFHLDEIVINGKNVTDEVNKNSQKGVEWMKENSDFMNKLVTGIMLKMINTIHSNKTYKREFISEIAKCWNSSA